jgi:hypothetical protein
MVKIGREFTPGKGDCIHSEKGFRNKILTILIKLRSWGFAKFELPLVFLLWMSPCIIIICLPHVSPGKIIAGFGAVE